MNVPTVRRRSKIAALGALATLLGACAAPIAEANFPARPDSVAHGDLRGPFLGRVVDKDTAKPIEAAAVLASWAWESGLGIRGPEATHSWLGTTDADGRYRVERQNESERGNLARFSLVIYKKGYVAYRSDRRWEDMGPRVDFTQTGNQIKLDRFPPDGSHVRHLRFVGAGGPLTPYVSWELQQASDEAAAGRREAESAARKSIVLDARALLSADELKAVTGFAGQFTVEKLGDLPTTGEYDSIHFRAIDKTEKFDAAARLFRPADAAEVEKQYQALLKEYPDANEKNEVGDRSLRAKEGDILAVVTVDKRRGMLIVFTCGVEQCKDYETVVAIVKRMLPRLDKAVRTIEEESKP